MSDERHDPGPEVLASRPRSPIENGLIWGLVTAIFCCYLAALVRHRADLWRRVRKFIPDTALNEELKAIVQHRLAELRVWRMRMYLLLVCCACVPRVLELVADVINGSSSKVGTPASEIVWLTFQACCALIFVKPAWLKPGNLDVASLFVAATAVILASPLMCCTEEAFKVNTPLFNLVLMIGHNLGRGLGSRREMIFLAVCNAVFVCCVTYGRWRAFRHVETYGSLAELAAAWGSILAVSMLFGAVIEAGFRQLVTQGLQLAEAREMHKAATALLRSCYDVVVDLNSSGSVEGASQDLGSLLLRAHHNRSMHGVRLADLIVDEEDRRQFQCRLLPPMTETAGLAENMHVTMKDALGNALRMELMWFACRRAEGADHFIVGIREFSDQMQVRLGDNSNGQGPRPPDSVPALTYSLSVESSSSEGTASPSEAESVDIEAESAAIVVDLTSPGYPIRGLTTGFRAHVGYVSRNAPLGVIVRKTQPMVNWMQNTLNSIVHDTAPPEDHRVSLRLPQGKLVARCRLVPSERAGTLQVDVENVVVLFYNITRSRSRRRSGSGSGLNGTPACPAPDPIGIASL